MSEPHGQGETASVYRVRNFAEGMATLAAFFQLHPDLRGVQATVDKTGHVDIIAVAENGVLRDWIRALPEASHKRDMYAVHYGHEWEEVLIDGPLTVHVRQPPKAGA